MKIWNRFNSQIVHRRIVLIIFDIMTVCVSSIIPLWLRFIDEETIPDVYIKAYGHLQDQRRHRTLWLRAFCVQY